MNEDPRNSRRYPNWYRSRVDKQTLKRLSTIDNWKATQHVFVHFFSLGLSGTACWYAFEHGQYLVFLFLLAIHCTLLNFLGMAGAGHEFSHNRVFSSRKLNGFLFKLCAFLTWNNPVIFKRSHKIHHLYTLNPDYDFEVNPQNFPTRGTLIRSLSFDYETLFLLVKIHLYNSFGRIKGRQVDVLFPANDLQGRQGIMNWSRLLLLDHITLTCLFIFFEQYVMVLLVCLARYFFSFLPTHLAFAQHAGLPPKSEDFRTNTRTVKLPSIISYFYWRMNYHVEHHMYSPVPEYNLAELSCYLAYDRVEQPTDFSEVLKILYKKA